MKNIFIFILLFFPLYKVSAQKYMTSTGYIELSGEMPFQNIKAVNNQVASILDPQTGTVQFYTLMKSFHFKLEKMEEIFNSDFAESDLYPKSTFKGTIEDISAVDFNKPGTYKITVNGYLTIHNVTRPVTHNGILEVSETGLTAGSKFKVRPEDFNITLPVLFGKKIAREINMSVMMKYNPVNNLDVKEVMHQ
jgi:hypothetical protein